VPPRLDAIDRQILKELQDDGRITNVELASRVGISAPPCLRRVRALEQAGYIKGYRALLDEKLLGYEVTVFAMVHLSSQPGRSQAFGDFVRKEPWCANAGCSRRDRLHPQCRASKPSGLRRRAHRRAPCARQDLATRPSSRTQR
jgi:hypothetical protein